MVHEYEQKKVVMRVTEDNVTDTSESDDDDDLPTNQTVAPELEPAAVVTVAIRSTLYACHKKASSVLESEEWLDAVKKDFVSDGQEIRNVDDDLKNTANLLQKLLLQ